MPPCFFLHWCFRWNHEPREPTAPTSNCPCHGIDGSWATDQPQESREWTTEPAHRPLTVPVIRATAQASFIPDMVDISWTTKQPQESREWTTGTHQPHRLLTVPVDVPDGTMSHEPTAQASNYSCHQEHGHDGIIANYCTMFQMEPWATGTTAPTSNCPCHQSNRTGFFHSWHGRYKLSNQPATGKQRMSHTNQPHQPLTIPVIRNTDTMELLLIIARCSRWNHEPRTNRTGF